MRNLLRSNAPRYVAARLAAAAIGMALACGGAIALAGAGSDAHATDPLPVPVTRTEADSCLRQLGLATRPTRADRLYVRFSDVTVRFTFHPDQRQANTVNAGHYQRFGGTIPPLPAVVNNVSYRALGPLAYTHLVAAESCLLRTTTAGA